jgi:formaldehyde-activating enzyme involved in methanogenesis
MTHTKDEALLKALEDIKNNAGNPEKVYQIASAAIKQALAAPVQETDHLREFKKDMLRANYQPKSEATFGFKEYGYYVDKDGNGKIGILPK